MIKIIAVCVDGVGKKFTIYHASDFKRKTIQEGTLRIEISVDIGI